MDTRDTKERTLVVLAITLVAVAVIFWVVYSLTSHDFSLMKDAIGVTGGILLWSVFIWIMYQMLGTKESRRSSLPGHNIGVSYQERLRREREREESCYKS